MRKNQEGLSGNEYQTGVKNIIKKMKNINDNDILSQVKAKTANLTKRFETRIEKEKVKTEKIKEISNFSYFLRFLRLENKIFIFV